MKSMRPEMDNGKYIKRCYEPAVQAGKKGFGE